MDRLVKRSKFADNMVYNEEYVIPLLAQILGVSENHDIPNLHTLGKFQVFSYEIGNKSKVKQHCNKLDTSDSGQIPKPPGIVLKVKTKLPLLLRICENANYDRKPRLYLQVGVFKGDNSDLKHRGYVREKGMSLLLQALKLLDRLSYLFKYSNSFCYFVPRYLTLIGLGNYRFFDDSERILMVAGGSSVADILKNMMTKQKKSKASYV